MKIARYGYPRVVVAVAVMGLAAATVLGHGVALRPNGDGAAGRVIEFPDTAEYQTLVVDLHTHSVFSDGHVWPKIRVGEALRDGLDAMAVTEHLEFQPHRADIPHPDRNRSYQETLVARGDEDLIIIAGSEITRAAPAGHMNAVFVDDANKLFKVDTPPEDPTDVAAFRDAAARWPAQDAVQAANDQGAFIFWNHSWSTGTFPNGIPVIPEFHADNAANKLLHGIEIANGQTYSEEAFQIALDHDLALIGVSDVHDLIAWDYEPHGGGHRPVTLVLADDRTPEAIREALFAHRTVVWFKNLLLGRAPELSAVLGASLTLERASYLEETDVLEIEIANHSDAEFQLRNESAYTFAFESDLVQIPPHHTAEFQVKTRDRLERLEIEFEVLNALVAPRQTTILTLSADVSD